MEEKQNTLGEGKNKGVTTMPMGFGLTVIDKKPKKAMVQVRKSRGISMAESFFAVRPFGRRRPFPWAGKKTTTAKAVDTTMEFMMRPFVLQAEYAPKYTPTKKQIRLWKRQQKLGEAPKFGDYIWKRGGKKAKAYIATGGTAGFLFAPNPLIGLLGGVITGMGLYAYTHPKTAKRYRKLMWEKYKVRKKHIWQY